MKPFLPVLAACLFALGGCDNRLPKPTNANGSLSPSVVVAEAEITYRNATHDAALYTAKCHAAPSTAGCSEQLIQQLKVASDRAWDTLVAAENAVRTLPATSAGLAAAIADMQAALVFLQSFVTQIPAK